MATTIRINIANTNPLDGMSTPPANSKSRLVNNKVLGITELSLNNLEPFGLLDPGFLGLLGITGSYMIRHMAVLSGAGGAIHTDGSLVAVRSPAGPGATQKDRQLAELGPTDLRSQGSGMFPRGFSLPIPVGHSIVFDTAADGLGSGPHIVQVTFDAVRGQRLIQVPDEVRGGGPPG